MAASVQGRQGEEFAPVREPYWVQGIVRTMHILFNIDSRICNRCRPPVPHVAEECQVPMGE